jgi:hypothetical protein
MSNRKRDCEAELEDDPAISAPTNKRTKPNDVDTSGPTHRRAKRDREFYESLVLVWSQPMTVYQQNFLTKHMEELVGLKSAANFIKTHTEKHMPHQAKKTNKARDLTIMKSLLITGGYSSVAEVFTDFRDMILNVTRTNEWTHVISVDARRLFRCFCGRMKLCPTGPDGAPYNSYGRDGIKLIATTQAIKPSSDRSVIISIEDSDESEVEGVINHSDTLPNENQYHSLADISDKLLSMPDEPPPTPILAIAKTPGPSDRDDEGTRQLSKEIEECQQKLARMVEKKRLLQEIRDLDIEKAAIDVEIPEMEEQLKQLTSKTHDYHKQIDSVMEDGKAFADSRDWHDQESIRLQQESEKLQRKSEKCRQESVTHRQENERLRSIADEYQRKMDAFHLLREQSENQSNQVLSDGSQLRHRRDQIEDQRAIAQKKLEELAHGAI